MTSSTAEPDRDAPRRALVVGASRNLGLGIAGQLAQRGWGVTGTVRGTARTGLHALADAAGGNVAIEHVDITVDDDIRGLRDRLARPDLDLLLVNAGITDTDVPVGEVDAEVFARVMVTNALAPMHVVEILEPVVAAHGTIAVMSSRQGSIGLNTRGGHEVYRASKSALNQLMRSYATRAGDDRALLLIHPGWVQTELGGAGAPLSVEQSVVGIVDMVERHLGEPGLQFRDFQDGVVPW